MKNYKILFICWVFFLWRAEAFAQPSNDGCTGATTLPQDGTCLSGTTVNATDGWAGTVGCAGNNREVWYTFTSTGTQGQWIITNGTLTGNIEFVLGTGTSCANPITIVNTTCGASPLNVTVGLSTGTLYWVTISSSTNSQGTFTICLTTSSPPPSPGQDCGNAAVLCDATPFTQSTSNAGYGTQEVTTATSCWGSGGERQSKWFKFSIGCSGTLEFNIQPNVSTDDYDWGLWNVSSGCASKGSTIACNWSGCTGSTGLSSCVGSEPGISSCMGAPDACSGTCGNYRAWGDWSAPYGTCLGCGGFNVTAGNIYALLVDNYTTSNSGFTLTFGGACSGMTAVIGPDAAFTASVSGCPPLTVNAVKTTCAPVSFTYKWYWGDGNTTTASPPQSHTYASGGTYIITLEVTDPLGCVATSSVTVSLNPLVASITSSSNITCNAGTNGDAVVTATDGASPYTYNWNSTPAQTASNATGLPAGNYTVTVTDNNGCNTTSSVTLTEPTAISVTPGSTDATCGQSNGTATATVSGGNSPYSYSWNSSPAQTTSTATGLPSGTYSVTVTDNSSCTATASATVNNPAGLTASITAQTDIDCSGGNNGSATVTASGGTAPYTYTWSNAQTASVATGLIAGNYTVTVKDNSGGSTTFWTETFNNGCTAGCLASSFSGANGAWSVSSPGANGGAPNQWFVSCAENGNGAGVCGSGCGANASLHVGANPNSFCTECNCADPSGDCGAAYDDCAACYLCGLCGFNNSPVTSKRAESPVIDCSGKSNITMSFLYIENGDGTNDNATVWYYNGATWSQVDDPPKTTVSGCAGGNHRWASRSFALPAGADNNPNVKIGFLWENNADDNAADPSFAVNDVTLSYSSSACSTNVSVTITEPAVLSAAVSGQTNISCNGDSDGTATVSVTGGTAAYSYNWTGGQTTTTATGLTATNYTVTVTDSKSCTSTATASITQPAVLSATVTGQINASCNGDLDGSADVTAGGGTSPYSYSWNTTPVQTNSTATALGAGSYTVTATDANSCTKTASVTITEPAALSSSASKTDVACYGDSTGSINLTPAGGTTPYTFAWSNAAITEDINNLPAGNYYVTITDANGCTSLDSGAITEPAALSLATSTTDASCGSSNGSATATPSGGVSPYTWLWDVAAGGQTTSSATGLAAGAFPVTVTDANNCTQTATATVFNAAAPVISGTPVNVLCNGNNTGSVDITVSGGTPPYTYSWSNSAATEDINGLVAGVYRISLTDSVSCIVVDSFTVTEPSALSAAALPSDVTCNGANDGSVNLTVGGGFTPYTFIWSNSAATEDLNGLAGATYTVTVTDSAACTVTTSATVNEPSVLNAAIVLTNISCNGGSNGAVDLTVSGGTPPYAYSWSNLAVTEDISALTAAAYSVTVTDSNGCQAIQSGTVTEPAPLSLSVSTVDAQCGVANGEASATVSGGVSPYSYLWDAAAGNQTTSTATGLIAGAYSVTVADSNGCTLSSAATVSNSGAPVITGVITDILCNGNSTGSVDITVTGGTPPLTYAWSNSASTEDINGVAAATYTVSITDSTLCVAVNSFTVTEPAALSISSSITDVGCNGDSTGAIDLTVSGGSPAYTFSWSNGTMTEDVSLLPSGNYNISITDANGCMDSLVNLTVTEPAALNASVTTTDASCGANDGTATISASGGVGSYSYQWDAGAGSQTSSTATALSAGFYSVTIIDGNNCILISNAAVNNAGAPTASITSSADLICAGVCTGSAEITAAGGTPPYTYLWDDGESASLASALCSGNHIVTVTDNNTCIVTANTALTEPAALSVSLLVLNNVTCNGGSDGNISINVSGGTPGYGYSWSTTPSQSTTIATALSAATYTVTVTDTNSCSVMQSFTVTEPAVLTVSINQTDVTCNGGNDGTATSIPSGGTPGYSYLWSTTPAQSASTATGLVAGGYSVTVTDTNNCSILQSVSITEPVALAVIISGQTNVSCFGGNNGAATAAGSGGTSPYSFTWNTTPPQNIAGATGLIAGSYTVTITDNNNCSATVNTTVTEPVALTSSIPSVTNLNCAGVCTGTATLAANGGIVPYTYLWSNGETATTATGLCASTISVAVTDNNACTAISSVTITEPPPVTVTASFVAVTCNGGNDGSATATTGGGSGSYTYLWSTVPAQSFATATGLSAGNYAVTVTDSLSCTDTVSVTVTDPPPLVALISGNLNICEGQSTILSSISSASYQWSTGASTQSVNVTPTYDSTYFVTITDASGCTADTEATVTVNPNPVADAGSNEEICLGQNVQLGATSNPAATGYSWLPATGLDNPNIFNPYASPAVTTVYTVTASIGSCTGSDSVTVAVDLLPVVELGPDVTINQGESYTLNATGGGTYSWVPATDLTCSNCPNPSATPGTTTKYIVTVSDTNQCVSRDSITINVEIKCEEIYIPNIFSPNGDGQNDVFMVFGTNCVKTLNLLVYDRWGEKVFETGDKTGGWKGDYNGKILNAGVFVWILKGEMNNGDAIDRQGNVAIVK